MNHNRCFCSSGALVVRHSRNGLQVLDEDLPFTVTDVFTNARKALFRLGLAACLQVNIYIDLVH